MKTQTRKLVPLLTLLMMLCLLFIPVSAQAATVKLNKTTLTLSVGDKSTLKVSGTSKKVTWSSSKTSVATVSSKGVVKGVGAGSATIKAKVNGKTYKCKVTVMKLNKTTLSVTMGKTSTLKVSGTSKTVKWSSSDTSVATVSSKGVVKGILPGTATIKAKVSGKTYKCKVTVKNANATAKSLKFKSSDGGVFISGTSSAKISFYLSASSANVVVSIKSSSGSTVYKKTYSKCTKGKTYSFTWDGKKTNGKAAGAGTYTVTVKAGSKTTTSSELVIKKQEFAGGTGSKSDPFQVTTLAQFKKVAEYDGYYFKQTTDIDGDLSTISGIFSSEAPFTGVYDGNGKTISNLIIQDSSKSLIALFGGVGTGGKIKNLTLSEVSVIGTANAAILVGDNYGTISNCTLKNCTVSNSGEGCRTAGLCVTNEENAKITGCSITDCNISATSSWNNLYAGGLVDRNYGTVIDSTISSTEIKGSGTAYLYTQTYTYMSGLVRCNYGTVSNCGASGVTLNCAEGRDASGGICQTNYSVIKNCYFSDGSASNDGVLNNLGTVI